VTIVSRSVVFLVMSLGLAGMVEEAVSKHNAMPVRRLHRAYHGRFRQSDD
jgi:hypothetical protein